MFAQAVQLALELLDLYIERLDIASRHAEPIGHVGEPGLPYRRDSRYGLDFHFFLFLLFFVNFFVFFLFFYFDFDFCLLFNRWVLSIAQELLLKSHTVLAFAGQVLLESLLEFVVAD